MAEGYQKWHGAPPSFISRAITRMYCRIGLDLDQDDSLVKIIAADPSACARKYLIPASVSVVVLFMIIIGMNLNRFSSIIIHTVNQFVLARVRTVLRIIIVTARM